MNKLSKRMQAVAALVQNTTCLADVGCDHGYVPIYLIQSECIGHAIAMDVNRGPLLRAEEHIREVHLEDYIETRLSDGLTALAPSEADGNRRNGWSVDETDSCRASGSLEEDEQSCVTATV